MNNLIEMESQARQHLDNALNSWMSFVSVVLDIQSSGLWKQSASTWQAYCLETFQIDSARIRQLKSALPYAEKIKAFSEHIECNEYHIRKLSQVVDSTDTLMPMVFNLGKSIAGATHTAPSVAIFQHTYDVLQELETTGHLDIGTGQVLPISEDALQLAVLTKMQHARQRLSDRLAPRTKYTGVMHRVNGGHYALSIEGDNLPNEARVTVYLEEFNNE